MICPNCGNNMPDGVAFCNICGTAFSAPQNAAPQYAVPPVAPPQYGAMPPQAMPQPPKKNKTGLIIGIVVAVIALIVGVLAISGVFSPKTEEEQIQKVAEETAKKIERGKIDGNTYTNDSIGLSFEKLSDWKFATDEEMAKMAGAGMEATDLDDMEKALAKAITVYDMSASSSDGMKTATVAIVNAEKAEIKDKDATKYLEELKTEFVSPVSDEISYECGEITETKLSGKTFSCLELTANGFINQNMYARFEGDFLILVTTVSVYSDNLEEIEAMFK